MIERKLNINQIGLRTFYDDRQSHCNKNPGSCTRPDVCRPIGYSKALPAAIRDCCIGAPRPPSATGARSDSCATSNLLNISVINRICLLPEGNTLCKVYLSILQKINNIVAGIEQFENL